MVSGGHRWRLARCLDAGREEGDFGSRRGIVRGLKRFIEETEATAYGCDNFTESLIGNTSNPPRTRVK